MKAIICPRYGSPDVLEMREVERPHPKSDEILVRIFATAVNSGDVRVRGLVVSGILKIVMRLVLGFNGPRKKILGTVYSGLIEEVGDKIKDFRMGDKVFGMTGFGFGTYAEYVVVKGNGTIAPMPEGANFEQAVSLIFGGQTALYFLEKAKIHDFRGKKILIIGATGAVGSAAIQLALHYGAEVSAVCSSEGRSLVESLGVKRIFLYDKQEIASIPDRFDFVFDAVGKTSKRQCSGILTPKGVFKTVGGMEMAAETKKQLMDMKALFEGGYLKPVIDKVYSFDQMIEAHRYVDAGRKKGNVVVRVVAS